MVSGRGNKAAVIAGGANIIVGMLGWIVDELALGWLVDGVTASNFGSVLVSTISVPWSICEPKARNQGISRLVCSSLMSLLV